MLTGAGSIALCSTELATNGSLRGEDLIMPACIAEFELSADSNFAEAKCLTDGKLQVEVADILEENYTLTLSYEYMDWNTMQVAYNELAQVQGSVALPVVKTAVVPAGGVITDADITAASEPSVKAYITIGKERIFANKVTSAPAAKNEVQVDGTAGALTFFGPDAIGAIVTYVVNKTYTNVESIGVGAPNQLGRLQFSGLVYGTEFSEPMLLVLKSISRISVPTLTINGDLATLQVEYRASIAPGSRSVYQLYNLATAD